MSLWLIEAGCRSQVEALFQNMSCDGGGEEVVGGSGDEEGGPAHPSHAPSHPCPTLPPLAAKLNKLSCDTEEPRAGPSNSAAQFDLEVGSLPVQCFTNCCLIYRYIDGMGLHYSDVELRETNNFNEQMMHGILCNLIEL